MVNLAEIQRGRLTPPEQWEEVAKAFSGLPRPKANSVNEALAKDSKRQDQIAAAENMATLGKLEFTTEKGEIIFRPKR